MGVPAFFKWLTEKYPHVVTHAVEQVPTVVSHMNEQGEQTETILPLDLTQPNPNAIEFDNLYLDMNGIIHPCCHPEGEEAPPTEELMVELIFKYVDRVFALVRPRNLLYLAIDGPAPRAKQNQQRSRRFRSAKEARDNDELEETLRKDLIEKGMIPPPKKSHWDSNVITPGTVFMDKVAKGLRYYIHHRMNTDPAWKNLKVILSDASVPGEGEHKIMQFIRAQRAQPGYNPNTKHVLHGLDADLIMLALGTHEFHFYILREQVFIKNGKQEEEEEGPKRKKTIAEQYESKPFQFLRVPILREYLGREFSDLRSGVLPFEFDLERIIDDFVFMCFFVGNDFLPHLPSLDIRDGAIDLLFNLYRKALVTMGGYITCDGDVDLRRAQYLLQLLGNVEDRIFVNKLQDQRRRESFKKRREAEDKHRLEMLKDPSVASDQLVALGSGSANPYSRKRKEHPSTEDENREAAKKLKGNLFPSSSTSDDTGEPERKRIKLSEEAEANVVVPSTTTATTSSDENKESAGEGTLEYLEMQEKNEQNSEEKREMNKEENTEFKKTLKKVIFDSKAVDEEKHPDLVIFGEQGWKSRYYKSKFEIEPDPKSERYQHIVRSYIEGLVWVFRYYYKGCTSWNWFYPYHYAPFASDLGSIPVDKVELELGEPYKPFNQLMSVLPPDSAHALPRQYSELMTDRHSMIADFYPTDFKIDLNGKKRSWMGVALLPFIVESRLLEAIETVEDTLNHEERVRNSLSKDLLYIHSNNDLAPLLMPVLVLKKTVVLQMTQGGISGTVEFYPNHCPADETYDTPWPSKELEPVKDNAVASVFYTPPTHITISTKLLPGLKTGDPVLPKLEQELGYVDSGRGNRTLEKLLRDIEYDQQRQDGTYRGGGGGNDSYNRNNRGGYDNRSYNDQRYNNSRNDGRGGTYDNNRRYDNRGGYDNRNSNNNRGYDNRGGYDNNRGGGYDRSYRGGDNRGYDRSNNSRNDNRSGGGYDRNRGRDNNRDEYNRDRSSSSGRYSQDYRQQHQRPYSTTGQQPYSVPQQQQAYPGQPNPYSTSARQGLEVPQQQQQQQQYYAPQPYPTSSLQSQQHVPSPYQQQQAQPYPPQQPMMNQQPIAQYPTQQAPNPYAYNPYLQAQLQQQQQEFPTLSTTYDANGSGQPDDDTSKYLQ